MKTPAAAIALSCFAVAAGGATAHGDGPSPRHGVVRDLVRAYQGTVKYLDVQPAKDDGYTELRDAQGIACIDNPGVGGMGTHYVKGVADTVIDPATPDALVYETTQGKLRLVAAEYIVFQKAWDADHRRPPKLFGRRFALVPDGNRFGVPAFYELHVWLWKPNPRGLFDDWNPNVTCPAP